MKKLLAAAITATVVAAAPATAQAANRYCGQATRHWAVSAQYGESCSVARSAVRGALARLEQTDHLYYFRTRHHRFVALTFNFHTILMRDLTNGKRLGGIRI